jgi:uncharacterized protein YbaA (DUF1428 family)
MIKLHNISGNVIKVLVPAQLRSDDFTELATEANALIKQHGKIRLLIDATQFDGWENLHAFEKHLGFVKSHQKNVERIAVIAKHNWQHWIAGVIKSFVHPDISVYDKENADAALQWITE